MQRKAYAKVNLRLHVLNKRTNGYHSLQMINAHIDLYDCITIRELEEDVIRLTFSTTELDAQKDDLIVKMIACFKHKYQIRSGFDIYIEKYIPIGAGLGGGSMDAGVILNMICDIANVELTLGEKIQFASSFGADIPYAFFEAPALVEGIGEIITPIELEQKSLILVFPKVKVDTKKVFMNQYRYSLPFSVADYVKAGIWDEATLLYNDLEAATFALYPELRQLKAALEKDGTVTMSGSGSTLLVFPKRDIIEVEAELQQRYSQYVIKRVNIL